MDQPVVTATIETRNRKSISEVQYNPSFPTKNPVKQMSLHSGSGSKHAKRTKIKIPRNRLPEDFFFTGKTDLLRINTNDTKIKLKKELILNTPDFARKASSQREIQAQQQSQKMHKAFSYNQQSESFKKTSFFGTPDRKPIPFLIQSEKRQYKSRAQQKRSQKGQRKMTATISPYQYEQIQKIDSNEIVVFTGTFAKDFKGYSQKTSPRKQVVTPIRPVPQILLEFKSKYKTIEQSYSINQFEETSESEQKNFKKHSSRQSKEIPSITHFNTKSSVLPPISNR